MSFAPHLSLLSFLSPLEYLIIPNEYNPISDLDGAETRNRMKRADKNWFPAIECENYPGENRISISMRVQDI